MSYTLLAVVVFAIFAAWAPRLWAVSLPQAALFSAAAVLCLHRFRRNETLRYPVFLAAPAGLAVIAVIQLITHVTVYLLPTAYACLDWAAYLACGWLAAQVAPRLRSRDRMLELLTYVAGIVGVLAVLTALTSPFRILWLVPVRFEQVFGPYVYRNHLAAFVELSVPLALYFAIRERARRSIFLLIAAVLVAAVVVAASRTGLVLVGVELLAMLVLAAYKRWLTARSSWVFALILAVSVGVGVAATGISPVQARFAEDHPYRVRYEILLSTVDMARARPLTGWGLGNFRTVYPGYARIDPGVLVNEAHNDWAQWAAEGGTGALVAMLFLAAWAVRMGIRTGWGLGVAVVFCHALVDYPFEEPSIVLLLMLLCGLASHPASDLASHPANREGIAR